MKATLLHHTQNITLEMFTRARGTTTSDGFDAVYREPHKYFDKKTRIEREHFLSLSPEEQYRLIDHKHFKSSGDVHVLQVSSLDREYMQKFVSEKALDAKHWSVTRGCHWTFAFEMSRSSGRQALRHTVGAWPEEFSQRYSKVANQKYLEKLQLCEVRCLESPDSQQTLVSTRDILAEAFEIPPHLSGSFSDPKTRQLLIRWLQGRIRDLEDYLFEISQGVPVEDAREGLPNATTSYLEFTFSFEALRNFLAKRLCDRAQTPIRMLARSMRKQVLEIEPWLAPYLGIQCSLAHYCPEVNPGQCKLHFNNGGLYLSEEDLIKASREYARSHRGEK